MRYVNFEITSKNPNEKINKPKFVTKATKITKPVEKSVKKNKPTKVTKTIKEEE